MDESVKIDYQQLCKEYEFKIDEIGKQNEELKAENRELKAHIEHLRYEKAKLEGQIDGLVFSIRCNGVACAETYLGQG